MGSTFSNFIHQTIKSVTSEDQIPLAKPKNKHRIKPIFPRIPITDRKREPNVPSSAVLKNSYFTRHAIQYPKDNQLDYFVDKVETLQKGLRSINGNLKHLGSLQKFTLHADNCGRKVTDLDFSDSQTLKRPVSLQSLKLSAVNCSLITKKGFYCLGQSLKRLSSLKHFDFSLWEHINDEGFNYLTKSLKRLTSLERLTLDLRSCKGITELGVSTLSASLKNLLLLKNLTICFSPNVKITERGFFNLCESLERLVQLQSFSFNLTGFLMTDVGLKRFGEVLKKLISLRKLDISLPDLSRTTDLGFLEFSKGLKKLVCLQEMKLKAFINANINNNRLLYLSKALRKLVCLKNLEIQLNNRNNNFDDLGLSHLRNGLDRLKSLEKFKLDLEWANLMTDEGLSMLSEGLKNLVLLQELFLAFEGSKITNEGAQNFCKVLTNLTRLKGFWFHLSECPNFTESGLFMICQVLKDIPSIEGFGYMLEGSAYYLDTKLEISNFLKCPHQYLPSFMDLTAVKRVSILLFFCVVMIGVFIFWLVYRLFKYCCF